MKLIPYDPYRLNTERCSSQIAETIDELRIKVERLYGLRDFHLLHLKAIFNILDPKGKTVLDLGCGSVNSYDNRTVCRRMYEPWLLRALHEYGANCVGVDAGGLDGEKFKGYKINLLHEDSLAQFETHSVDIATAFAFFDSPALWSYLGRGAGEETFKRIMPQLERIVKPEGFFLFENWGTSYKHA